MKLPPPILASHGSSLEQIILGLFILIVLVVMFLIVAAAGERAARRAEIRKIAAEEVERAVHKRGEG